jgi:hypothetical protein
MFDRLKEFYQHRHELAALETLSDPSEYEGLAKLHRKDLQIKHARLFLKSTRLRFEVWWTDEVESA